MDQSLFPQRQTAGNMALVDPAVVAAAESAKALIQASFFMAFQKPRNQLQARANILAACKRTEFAEKAEYSKPIGKIKNDATGRWEQNFIKGPSVRFAELAIREWENVDISTIVLYEDDDVKRLRVSAIDLETNSKFSRDIQIKKTIERKSKKGREDDVISDRKNSYGDIVYVLRATDEEMLTKESAWVSKIIRNEGLRLIPTDIIEEGLQQCRETLRSRASMDPEGEKKKLVDAFADIGVKPVQLEKYLGHDIGTISPSEIADLRSVFRTIRDGEARWSDYVGAKEDEQHAPSNDDVESALKNRTPIGATGTNLIGADDEPTANKVIVAADGGSEPVTSASQYNGANSHPPDGHTDGEGHTGPGQANETTPSNWDPRTKPVMKRYVNEKSAIVKSVAEEMGIPLDGRMPADVHADIIAMHQQSEAAEEQTEKADEHQQTMDDLRDQLISLRAGEATKERYTHVVNTMMNAGALPGSMVSEWTEDQRYSVIDAVNEKF